MRMNEKKVYTLWDAHGHFAPRGEKAREWKIHCRAIDILWSGGAYRKSNA